MALSHGAVGWSAMCADHSHLPFIGYCKLITEYGWMAINSVKYNSNNSTILSNFSKRPT